MRSEEFAKDTAKNFSIRDAMRKNTITLTLDEELHHVSDLTPWKHFDSIPVVDNRGRAVGVISYQNLLQHEVFRRLSATKDVPKPSVRCRDILSTDFLVAAPETPAIDAARMLVRSHQSCLLVLQDGYLVGIVSADSLLELLTSAI